MKTSKYRTATPSGHMRRSTGFVVPNDPMSWQQTCETVYSPTESQAILSGGKL